MVLRTRRLWIRPRRLWIRPASRSTVACSLADAGEMSRRGLSRCRWRSEISRSCGGSRPGYGPEAGPARGLPPRPFWSSLDAAYQRRAMAEKSQELAAVKQDIRIQPANADRVLTGR
jgi:hypothetical protein